MRAIEGPLAIPRALSRLRMVGLFLALAGWLLPLSGLAGEFETANQSYDQGQFKEAKQGYEKLIEAGSGSPNVFYNLGNTEFRLDSPGRAILDYERALTLNPHHPEARANLSLLRERTGAKLLPFSWSRTVAGKLAPKVWSIVAAAAAWVVLFGLVSFCGRRRAGPGDAPASQESNFAVGLVTFLGVVVCATAGTALWRIARDQALGIITVPETQARLAPAESAGVAAALPAGSQVRVLSERGGWIYCEMPNASRGWIASDAVEKIAPSKS